MNRKILVIGILIILIVVGLCGCNEQQTNTNGDNINYFKLKPIIGTFTITPNIITEGNTAELWWIVSTAESVSIDNGIGFVSLSGSRIVSPNVTTIYTMTAKNGNGETYATTLIHVNPGYDEIDHPSVVAEGTEEQIKLVLASKGDDYNGGYVKPDDVIVYIDGSKVVLEPGLWEVGGQILIGQLYTNWVEGGTCPEGDYEVTVSINNIVVFDGTITVEGYGGEIENASVAGEGTGTQIKLILASGGDNYDGGYVKPDDVSVFIDGHRVILKAGIWVTGGQILIGLSDSDWVEDGTCPEGDYEVTVAIMDTVVFDGTINVG